MPELPEVETIKRGITPVLSGQTIETVRLQRPDLRVPFPPHLSARLTGARLTGCRRRAKYLLLDFSNGLTLVIHLGMSGRISLGEDHAAYSLQKHDHMMLVFKEGGYLVLNDPRRFGMVYLIETDKLARHKAFAHLGPEPLSPDFNPDYLHSALQGRKTPIKLALLDQKIVVGLGNIYVCEALYYAGIDPRKPAGDVSKKAYDALVPAIKVVLEKALAAGGTTLKDYRTADGELGYFQLQVAVYGREGKACPDCDCDIDKTGGIVRLKQGGRATFWCPRKQS